MIYKSRVTIWNAVPEVAIRPGMIFLRLHIVSKLNGIFGYNCLLANGKFVFVDEIFFDVQNFIQIA